MEDQINFESRIDFTDLNEKITRIRERMGKVIIGQKGSGRFVAGGDAG